jgi:hypothetical protein
LPDACGRNQEKYDNYRERKGDLEDAATSRSFCVECNWVGEIYLAGIGCSEMHLRWAQLSVAADTKLHTGIEYILKLKYLP